MLRTNYEYDCSVTTSHFLQQTKSEFTVENLSQIFHTFGDIYTFV